MKLKSVIESNRNRREKLKLIKSTIAYHNITHKILSTLFYGTKITQQRPNKYTSVFSHSDSHQ